MTATERRLFAERKATWYSVDKSPKGSLDRPILDLLIYINSRPELLTTSSCSGRIAVFRKQGVVAIHGNEAGDTEKDKDYERFAHVVEEEGLAVVTTGVGAGTSCTEADRAGGGGAQPITPSTSAATPRDAAPAPSVNLAAGAASSAPPPATSDKGGSWIFVDHEPDRLSPPALAEEIWMAIFDAPSGAAPTRADEVNSCGNNIHSEQDAIDFLFEPFLLHVEAVDFAAAQRLLKVAQQAGYRESGICVGGKNRFMVHIRTTAFGLCIPVRLHLLTRELLGFWVCEAVQRFQKNRKRIDKFFALLTAEFQTATACSTSTSTSASSAASFTNDAEVPRTAGTELLDAAAAANGGAGDCAAGRCAAGTSPRGTTAPAVPGTPAVDGAASESLCWAWALLVPKQRAKQWKDSLQQYHLFDKAFGVKPLGCDPRKRCDFLLVGLDTSTPGKQKEVREMACLTELLTEGTRRIPVLRLALQDQEKDMMFVVPQSFSTETDANVVRATVWEKAAAFWFPAHAPELKNEEVRECIAIHYQEFFQRIQLAVEVPDHRTGVSSSAAGGEQHAYSTSLLNPAAGPPPPPDVVDLGWEEELVRLRRTMTNLRPGAGTNGTEKLSPLDLFRFLAHHSISRQEESWTFEDPKWGQYLLEGMLLPCAVDSIVVGLKMNTTSPKDMKLRDYLSKALSVLQVALPEPPLGLRALLPHLVEAKRCVDVDPKSLGGRFLEDEKYTIHGQVAFVSDCDFCPWQVDPGQDVVDTWSAHAFVEKMCWALTLLWFRKKNQNVTTIARRGHINDDAFRSPSAVKIFVQVRNHQHQQEEAEDASTKTESKNRISAAAGAVAATASVFVRAGSAADTVTRGQTQTLPAEIVELRRRIESARAELQVAFHNERQQGIMNNDIKLDPWNIVVDNGIKYTYNVEQTMFSTGNIKEKIRVQNEYFSDSIMLSLLSNEDKIVGEQGAKRQVCPMEWEVVVDLFAGIGYWTLPMLKFGPVQELYACEWNPASVEGLKRGLKLNFHVASEEMVALSEPSPASSRSASSSKSNYVDSPSSPPAPPAAVLDAQDGGEGRGRGFLRRCSRRLIKTAIEELPLFSGGSADGMITTSGVTATALSLRVDRSKQEKAAAARIREQKVYILQGDCRVSAPANVADRVVLGLLPSTVAYWETAIGCLDTKNLPVREGWFRQYTLHIHENVAEGEERSFGDKIVREVRRLMREKVISGLAHDSDCYVNGGPSVEVELAHIESVKSYAPRVNHLVYDTQIYVGAAIFAITHQPM